MFNHRTLVFCWIIVALVGIVMIISFRSASAGGWSILTLAELPKHVEVDQPVVVEFAVLQHGQTAIEGLAPTVRAVHVFTDERITIDATPSERSGYYRASVLFPNSGSWRWWVDVSGQRYAMPPLMINDALPVHAPAAEGFAELSSQWAIGMVGVGVIGTAVALYLWSRQRSKRRLVLVTIPLLLLLGGFVMQPDNQPELAALPELIVKAPAIAPDQLGEALFVAKGCIQCHRHDGVTMVQNQIRIGPDLTHYVGIVDYLNLWLKNPREIKPETVMPNLNLSDEEIQTLVGFLSGKVAE
jgi:hypothetical protein